MSRVPRSTYLLLLVSMVSSASSVGNQLVVLVALAVASAKTWGTQQRHLELKKPLLQREPALVLNQGSVAPSHVVEFPFKNPRKAI
jgi:hypothetical protein